MTSFWNEALDFETSTKKHEISKEKHTPMHFTKLNILYFD